MLYTKVNDPVAGLKYEIHETKTNGKFFVWTTQTDEGGDVAVIAHSAVTNERLCANACQRQWDAVLKDNRNAFSAKCLTDHATAIRSNQGTFLIYHAGGLGYSVISVPEKNTLELMRSSFRWTNYVPHALQETENGMVPVDKDNVCVVETYDRAVEIALEVQDDIPDFETEKEPAQ